MFGEKEFISLSLILHTHTHTHTRYGVPRYQEANPALFSCVTFPFLFGVMFGDVGHGILLFLVALTLVMFEKRLEGKDLGEVPGMLYTGRYMLLLMGIFATYCGLVYNECFCLPLNLFGTIYEKIPETNNQSAYYLIKDDPGWVIAKPAPVYSFGIDPTWHVAENELTFINSYKMKTSVILGVLQMTLGILVKFTNAFHFKEKNVLYFECIPQLLFMGCLFVYLIILIVVKWCTDWTKMKGVPNLINTMINMPLQMGARGDEAPAYNAALQDTLQPILLAVALLSVPMMLIPKPLIEYYAHKKDHHDSSSTRGRSHTPLHVLEHGKEEKEGLVESSKVDDADTYLDEEDNEEDDEEEAHSLGDLFIHQGIETIEFVLGCVSNTASYLRLWALSLAHAELAKTFWDLLMAGMINAGGGANFIMVFAGYSAWAAVSVFVLMCMDSLECFLHALRLHWVEFQNKFYKADGYAFVPFVFRPMDVILQQRNSGM